MTLSFDAIQAAQSHAREQYPNESCGFIVEGRYVPLKNIHEDPANYFRIDPAEWLRAKAEGGVQMVIHSHPDGPMYPNEMDMQGQVASGVPWAIITTDGDRVSNPVIWGGEQPPLLGRPFLHGVTDCYSLIRDTFAAGKDKLAAQGITTSWPFDPIQLEDAPRDDSWWDTDRDLYMDNYAKWGFEPIDFSEVRPGDVFFAKIRSEKFNHGGILIEPDLIMHHLPGRTSRREPAGMWARYAEFWVRYAGNKPNA